MTDRDKTCRTCDWYEPFNGVCCNGDSEHRADFTGADGTCSYWGNYDYDMYGDNPQDTAKEATL